MDQNWQGIDMLTDFVGPETTHFWFLCSPYSFVMSFQVWLEASLPFLKFWLLLTWSYIPTCVKIRSLKPSKCPTFGYFATSDMVSPCFFRCFETAFGRTERWPLQSGSRLMVLECFGWLESEKCDSKSWNRTKLYIYTQYIYYYILSFLDYIILYFMTLHYSIFYHILSYSTLLYYITS